MKKFLLIFFLCVCFLPAAGQNTLKFLGIPVDGTKKEFISKLQAKGFEYHDDVNSDYLSGEFNGRKSFISIYTVKNAVWRVCVIDEISMDEQGIRMRYNNLFSQMSGSGKYVCTSGSRIGDDENISYEMTVNGKRYEASFALANELVNGGVWFMLYKNYGEYRVVMYYENLDNAANGEDL